MNNFLKYISFTKSETRVIVFITVVLVSGFGIKYYKQVLSKSLEPPYDFSASDSEFRKKSKNNTPGNLLPDTVKDDLYNQLKASDESLSDKENPSDQKASKNIPQKSININIASKEELTELPGVGDAIAERIIIYRDDKKGFRKIEDLMNVSGIGKKKFEKIKNYIKAE